MSTPTSSPWDRPFEKWRVVDLKEELKRRNLKINGLKEDLVRRLEEAFALETQNPISVAEDPVVTLDAELPKDMVDEDGVETMDHTRTDGVPVQDKEIEAVIEKAVPMDINETADVVVEGHGLNDRNTVTGVDVDVGGDEEMNIPKEASLTSAKDSSELTDIPSSDAKLERAALDDEEPFGSTSQTFGTVPVETAFANNIKDEVPASEDNLPTQAEPICQVPENVSNIVECESVSTDYVSINQENKLKGNIDSFHVETETVKTEVLQPLCSNDAGDGPSILDNEVQDDKVAAVKTDEALDIDVEVVKMDDDTPVIMPDVPTLDSEAIKEVTSDKAIESKPLDDEPVVEKPIVEIESHRFTLPKEEKLNYVKPEQDTPNENDEFVDITEDPVQIGEKRRSGGEVSYAEQEASKRQRRWHTNNEPARVAPRRPPHLERDSFSKPLDLSLVSPVAGPGSNSSTPRNRFDKSRNGIALVRSDSGIDSDAPKERVVPPSQRAPTTSLKIDRFVRPFTLKAVQELLGKTGKVCSFWMDQIKTHCYVTYCSVEEAAATRDALYNLQWPPNGGRLLIAEYVEPEDVKSRVEGGPQSPAAVNPPTGPAVPSVPANSARPQEPVKLPPPPPYPPANRLELPPPPPLTPQTHPQTFVRERLPPPPPPRKVEPPVVTLDDLFKKTRATPRIYYLPLSDEQVAVRMASTNGDNRNRAAEGRGRI